jgi:hypothetical protein
MKRSCVDYDEHSWTFGIVSVVFFVHSNYEIKNKEISFKIIHISRKM